MRGFGANQAAFAIEGAVDLLAKQTGLDRWEIRWRNALEHGDPMTTGQPAPASVGIRRSRSIISMSMRRQCTSLLIRGGST